MLSLLKIGHGARSSVSPGLAPILCLLLFIAVLPGRVLSKLSAVTDLSLTMTDSPDPVAYGNNLTYVIKATNDGELTATGVKLTDTPPQGATLISATPSTGTCTGTRPINCSLGNINPGASATLTIVVKPPATPTVTNKASVTAREPDANAANNTATQNTNINFADLSLINTVSYERVAPGSKLSYLLTITNKTGATARSVKLTNHLPVETTFAACSALGGTCGGTGNNRFVTFPSLAVGESKTVVFTVSVKAAVAEGTIISAPAAIISALPDPVEGNNSATATATVTATPWRLKTNGKIAFSSDRAFSNSTEPTGIYTINASGTGDTPFPNLNFNFPRAPAWSPDGKKLAVQQTIYDNGQYVNGIYVISANGTGLLKVANAWDDNHRTAWSPDSKRIAFIGLDFFIYLVNVNGTGLSRLPKSPSYINDLAWSPDGTKLAYSKAGDIWVMNIDGSGQINLTHSPSSGEITPSWSPDGTKLLFVRFTNNERDVYVMNANGTGSSRLLNWADTQDPVWSPDGKKVLVVSGNELHIFTFDGAGHVQVTHNGFYNFEPSWQPIPTNTIPTPTPSPANLYSISGRITNSSGDGMWAQVNLSGTRTGTVYPDADGRFSIVRLPEGGNYTVTVENGNYSFDPPSYTFNNLTSNRTANFTLITIP